MTLLEKLGIANEPWTVESLKYDFGGEDFFVVNEETECDETAVCQVKTGLHDASLIAQAPAMLELLIQTAYFLEYIRIYEHPPIGMINKVTAIIQDATGKTWEEIKEMMEGNDAGN